ncbi:MAG TPA: hypothetical protein VEZ70_12235 [Allosphingosinicella sp.]|nr:hypothetical protein [Allosphingosinicella sp.]
MAALRARLVAGEHIVWTGKPNPASTMMSKWAVALFAIPWLLGTGYGFLSARAAGDQAEMVVAFIFVCVGLVMLATPVAAFFRARRTTFAITNRRLLAITRNGRSLTSILLSGVRQVERFDRHGGTTLRVPTALVSDGEGGRSVDYLELHGLSDGERAYQLLVGQ